MKHKRSGIKLNWMLASAWRQIWQEELPWREELLCSFVNAFLYFNLVAFFKRVICNMYIAHSLVNSLFRDMV